MRINNNLTAINTHRQLGISALDGAKSMEKLSSGLRINRAGDDAAGLAISEKMRGQIRGLNMASKNSADTISLIQTAEGALNETHSILQRMRELAVQSANDTNTDTDRIELQAEIKQLKSEIDRIGNTTEFNTKKLIDGSARGVADKIDGAVRVNNNSGVIVDPAKMSGMMDSVATDRSWEFDGAYMLVKVDQSKDTTGVNDVYKAEDFRLIGPNGAEYKFKTLDTDVVTTVAEFNKQAGTIVADGNFKVGAGVIDVNVTIGADFNKPDGTKLAAGSVLSKDSSHILADGESIKLNVNGEEVTVAFTTTGGMTVNGEIVAADKSITLGDGTILTNDATSATGTVKVTQGSVTLMAELTGKATTVIKEGSTIAAGSTLVADTAIGVGSVISEAGTFVPGNVKFGTGSAATSDAKGDNIQFGANTNNALDTNFENMKVGESFTFVFQSYQAASSDLADSIMAQIGANSGQTTFLSMGDMRAKALGVDNIDISTKWGAATAIETVNNALQKVSHQRSSLGAIQNRLEHTIKNLDTAAENLQAAESRIRDVDMAKEIMEFTKTNILQQASQAMLAQANQAPQSVLQLLR